MSRFFALGCSYTSYQWPTWADWVGPHFNYWENWGLGGIGNRAIVNRLSELHFRQSLTRDDCVVIQWSSPMREDRWYADKSWVRYGNIYNQPFYPEDWVKKYFDPFMCMMETVNYIQLAQNMLDNIGCEWYMTWMSNPDYSSNATFVDSNGTPALIELLDPDHKLQQFLKKINSHPNMIPVDIDSYKLKTKDIFNCKPIFYDSNKKICEEGHPGPIVHYHYAKEFVAPRLNIEFDLTGSLYEEAVIWSKYLSKLPRESNDSPNLNFSKKESERSWAPDAF